MAGPITHIVLAQKIYASHFSTLAEKDFYVGTSFPDIRYLGVIEREKTHVPVTDKRAIQKQNSFFAGVSTHVLVDQLRETYMTTNGVYDLVPKSPLITQAMKLYEDAVMYPKCSDWQSVASYFDHILPGESAYGIAENDLRKWHTFLQFYFTHGVTRESGEMFVRTTGKPDGFATELLKVYEELSTIPNFSRWITDFYDHFQEMIEAA